MSDPSLLPEGTWGLKSQQVVAAGQTGPGVVLVTDGVIEAILPPEQVPEGVAVEDLGSLAILPGLIDPHVHVNEPGRTEWEGFRTATRAAAAGGVTLLVDMPLNSIPATTSLEGLEAKRAAAQGQCYVDIGLWGGFVPGNTMALEELHDAGVFGFKCFLIDSGVPEFPPVGQDDLVGAVEELADLDALLLAHAELAGPIAALNPGLARLNPQRYRTWLAGRPPEAEVEAIRMLAEIARPYPLRLHIVHLSSAEAVAEVERARSRSVAITGETCPHYLFFHDREIPDRATEFKCAPPIRELDQQDALWAALQRGAIQLVASDHSPCPPAMKSPDEGNFMEAWGGVASVELGFSAVWTRARSRGFQLDDLAGWMSWAPACLLGQHRHRGAISPGYRADLVVVDPEARFTVDPEGLHQRHKVTPYAGQELCGRVVRTYLRGELIFEDGQCSEPPRGQLISREDR